MTLDPRFAATAEKRIIFLHTCGKPEKNDKDQQLEDFFRAAGARDVILAASGAMTKWQLAENL